MATGMGTGKSSISFYQSRSSSLPSPYLVLVIGQGRGREKVGRKNDASVVLEGEKAVLVLVNCVNCGHSYLEIFA